jgi:polyisoprenoid-binding protein YceI
MAQIFLTLLFGPILLLSNVQANEWRINWQHSKIAFSIEYMAVSEVDGSFNKYDGAFNFNPATKQLSDIELVIDSSSIDTDNNKRDSHLKKQDFFHVSKYPQILYKSKDITYKDGKPIKVDGYLTIKGIKRPVSLSVAYKGIKKDPWDTKKETLFLSGKTQIKRSDFNITWNKTMDEGGLILGDLVNIKIQVEAFKSGVRPAFSRFYLPTKDIKKPVTIETSSDTKKQESTPVKKKVVTSNIVKETNSTKGMLLNLGLGLVLFLLMIVVAIAIQVYLTKFLEKMKFNDTLTLVIPSAIIITLLIIVATKLAPFMGYGVHPWD